jgi:hypothetical protein
MKLFHALLCAGVLASGTVGQETRESPVRRKVLDWFESVRGPTVTAATAKNMAAAADLSLAKGNEVTVLVDGSLTRSGKAVYGTSWGEEFYSFVLTPDQAKAVGLAPDRVTVLGSAPSGSPPRVPKPAVVLSDVRIEGGSTVPGSARISGTLSYRYERPAKDAVPTLRVAYRLKQSILSFQPVKDLSDQGTLSFTIGPVNSEDGEVAFGPMPVFIEMVEGDGVSGGSVVSNTVGLLLDVRPDLDAFARLGIAMFDKIADLLATVQDRASAAKAVDDLKQLMIRNTAVVEAMERLAPTKEQDAEIERKYGAKMNAAAGRMQEQVTRLEQSDYAGEAFFEEVQKALEKK